MGQSEFTRSLRWQVAQAKEKEATESAKRAVAAGDQVAAAHHEARARAFYDSWRVPEAQREIDDEVVSQLRESLGHPDQNVRESARQGLDELHAYSR